MSDIDAIEALLLPVHQDIPVAEYERVLERNEHLARKNSRLESDLSDLRVEVRDQIYALWDEGTLPLEVANEVLDSLDLALID